jgi:hypothetical protein
MQHYFGVDLGKREDFSALAMIEHDVGQPQAPYNVRWLWRWPRETDYRTVVAHTAQWMARVSPGQRALVVDASGVGDAVVEMFIA